MTYKNTESSETSSPVPELPKSQEGIAILAAQNLFLMERIVDLKNLFHKGRAEIEEQIVSLSTEIKEGIRDNKARVEELEDKFEMRAKETQEALTAWREATTTRSKKKKPWWRLW
ncbi:MAG: hypothetical protein VR68_00875 [Peptococcaceae bacterium BRH_c4a]|nr:MAG: hypothetical protein VR68_00875 [Peptococcaceae bacterium BRH_c4a]